MIGTLEITPCPPLDLLGVVPGAANNCGPATTLEITGAGFTAGTTVSLFRDGEPEIVATDVDVQSSSSLAAELDLTGAATGAWTVQVANADSSNDFLLDALAVTACPTPTISAVSPGRAVNCGRLIEATVTGADFVAGTTVRLTRPGEPDLEAGLIDVQSGEHLVADFYVVPAVEPGLWDVVVQNTPGGETFTVPAAFDVRPCPPVLTGDLYVLTAGNGNWLFEHDGSTGHLLQLVVPPIDVFVAEGDSRRMFFGPNGNLFVATRSCPYTCEVFQPSSGVSEFDVDTGEYVRQFVATFRTVVAMDFGGPHNNLFVAAKNEFNNGNGQGGKKGIVREFDGLTGEPLGIFAVHFQSISSIRWAPKGNLLVAGGGTGAWEYDGITGTRIGPFGDLGSVTGVFHMEFGPNGNVFLTADAPAGLREYDGITGEFIRVVTSTNPPTWAFTIRPNGDFLAIGSLGAPWNAPGVVEYAFDGTLGGMFAAHPLPWRPDGIGLRPARLGDFDQNGFMVLDDFEQFQSCFTGPAGGPVGIECTLADFDRDTDVDLADFAGMQRAFVPLPEAACCIDPGTCIDDLQPACEDEGWVYLGDASSCAGSLCEGQVYENFISPGGGLVAFFPEADVRVGDDMHLTGTARNLVSYDLLVGGFGPNSCGPNTSGGPFDVTVKLYTGCPGSSVGSPFLFPAATATWTGIPGDGFTHLLQADGFSGVTLTDEVWMVITTTTDCSGWILGERAEVGLNMMSCSTFWATATTSIAISFSPITPTPASTPRSAPTTRRRPVRWVRRILSRG